MIFFHDHGHFVQGALMVAVERKFAMSPYDGVKDAFMDRMEIFTKLREIRQWSAACGVRLASFRDLGKKHED